MKPKNTRQAVALFRYGVISPAIYAVTESQAEYFRRLAKKEFDVPGLGFRHYTTATFKSWLGSYRRDGLDGLIPKTRSDAGISRVITAQLSDQIRELLEEHATMSAIRVRERLVESGHITSRRISEATLRRHIRQAKLRPSLEHPLKARKHYEKPFANDLWVMDFMHGPGALALSRRHPSKTYLVAALDDHSRFVTLARFYARENAPVVITALKEAFARHGLPRILYCDNGSAFSSKLLTLGCARLGVALVHSKPYDPASRGKIERFFRTLRGRFLAELDTRHITLDALNDGLDDWINHYHRRTHSATADSPLNRFLSSLGSIRRRVVTKQELDRAFYRTLWRTVRNDSTVSIDRRLWEVPPRCMGRRVEIRHPEGCPRELFLFEDSEPVFRLLRVDAAKNASTPRRPRFDIQDPED